MPEAIHHNESHIKSPGSPSHARRASMKVLNRNIDQVVLGDLLFDSWYFSPYPEAVLYGSEHHLAKSQNGEHKNGHIEKVITPMIPRLHVCRYCFKYTTNPTNYAQHVQTHVEDFEEDPEGWTPVPGNSLKVYEWEGFTVWDVDGEQQKLYCQNLSLFAKLFLEQKSVFFDTSGFHYFVLTYTPENHPSSPTRGRKRRVSGLKSEQSGPQTQVLGFFSKESLSWDANNLACILVFPPHQHRNLGQLLMAVSYKLSGWEWEDSTVGGPEKPLSALGRKGYLRFWSERIARFFMGQTTDAEGEKVFAQMSKKRMTFAKEEMTIDEIGDRTGMLTEDVIAALRSMGICEPSTARRKKKVESDTDAEEIEDVEPTTMIIKRSAILKWADVHRVDLVGPIKEEGFLGEWALSEEEEVLSSEENASSIADSIDP